MKDLSLCYLGGAGWRIRAEDTSLLIDPYFTRMSMLATLLGRAVPNVELIRRSTPPTDVILVTHPHHDHLMDVPEAARITSAQVYASEQGAELLERLGVPAEQLWPIYAGDHLACGIFEIQVFVSQHRLLFGGVPYTGPLRNHDRPPLRASDYRMDVQFSFLITINGLRILLASGIQDEPAVKADILLVGADATRDQLYAILSASKPRIVMPNHWDDMFLSLDVAARPMLTPPTSLIPSFKRIDLKTFARETEELLPGCEVILPKRLQPCRLPYPG